MWSSDVLPGVERLGDAVAQTQPAWLLVAVALHLCGQVARGLAWHGLLRASWPGCSRARVCAWHVCGAGLSGVLPARGGDVVRVALARRELPGATAPVLAGTLVAEGSFECFSGLLLVLVTVGLGVGALSAPPGIAIGVLGAAVLALGLLARASARVRGVLGGVARGATSVRDPRLIIRRVLPWQVAGRALRMGSMWCFLRAAGLPTGPAVVIAACAARGSGNTVPIPLASTATATAALLVALPLAAGHALDGEAIAALALVQTVVLTAVGVGLSVVLLCAVLGARTLPTLVQSVRALAPRAAPAPST